MGRRQPAAAGRYRCSRACGSIWWRILYGAKLLTPRSVLPESLELLEGAFATMKTDTVGLFLLDDMPVDRARRMQIISEIAGALDRLRDQFGWRFMFHCR